MGAKSWQRARMKVFEMLVRLVELRSMSALSSPLLTRPSVSLGQDYPLSELDTSYNLSVV